MAVCILGPWFRVLVSVSSLLPPYNNNSPITEKEPTQVNLYFIANNASHKFDEIENDSHVNVSFYDESTTSWASFTGIAKISQDKELIHKFWNYS